MTDPQAETLAALAAQVAELRGLVSLTRQELSGRIEVLAETLADALDAAAPGGPPAPYWLVDPETYAAQLAELTEWVTEVLLTEYPPPSGLRPCWRNHRQAIWELSTLAAEWKRTYGRKRPDLARALELYDRWLPNTLRRVDDITRNCTTQCAASPRLRLRASPPAALRHERRSPQLRYTPCESVPLGLRVPRRQVAVEAAVFGVLVELWPVLEPATFVSPTRSGRHQKIKF